MSFEHGTLIRWNDQRGYGFIQPDLENTQVFVHIKTFGSIARRPQEGDRVDFDSSIGEQGKRKATFARITESVTAPKESPRRTDSRARRQPTARPTHHDGWSSPARRRTGIRGVRQRMKPFVLALLVPVIGISWIAKSCSTRAVPSETHQTASPATQGIASTPGTTTDPVSPSANFSCQGKHHCSQMVSKDEAQFYLAHCPDMKADGDGDGEACEDQFGH